MNRPFSATRLFAVAFVLLCASLASVGQAPAAATAPPKAPRPGILLLAHGGSLEWNEEVRHVADRVDLSMPAEVAFGMATRSTMQAAIDRLVARKVTEIIAVPLFVSSHSSVIDSIGYLLGQRAQMPEDLKEFAAMDQGSMGQGSIAMDHAAMPGAASADALKPVVSRVPIRMVAALDAHPIVAEILMDRAKSISKKSSHEVVLLVAHGPVPDDDNKLWLADMSKLAEQMKSRTRYAAVECITLRDDADDPVRDAATKELRKKVEKITGDGKTPLIVPLLLSFGGIEDGLRKRLNGLVYQMPSQALLPDERITNWVLASAHPQPADASPGNGN